MLGFVPLYIQTSSTAPIPTTILDPVVSTVTFGASYAPPCSGSVCSAYPATLGVSAGQNSTAGYVFRAKSEQPYPNPPRSRCSASASPDSDSCGEEGNA